MEDRIIKKTIEILEEREEKERRKNNLVIYNIKEDETLNKKDQEEQDLTKCKDLFVNELQIEEAEIVEISRLGRKQTVENENRNPRPVLVKLTDTSMKWNIIKSAKKLRDTRNEEQYLHPCPLFQQINIRQASFPAMNN